MLFFNLPFRHFLDAKDFALRTNHKPIGRHFHNTSSSLTSRHHRHFDYIAQMTNQVKYVKGESNAADLPSRPIVQPKLNAILPTTSATINIWSLQKLKQQLWDNGAAVRQHDVASFKASFPRRASHRHFV